MAGKGGGNHNNALAVAKSLSERRAEGMSNAKIWPDRAALEAEFEPLSFWEAAVAIQAKIAENTGRAAVLNRAVFHVLGEGMHKKKRTRKQMTADSVSLNKLRNHEPNFILALHLAKMKRYLEGGIAFVPESALAGMKAQEWLLHVMTHGKPPTEGKDPMLQFRSAKALLDNAARMYSGHTGSRNENRDDEDISRDGVISVEFRPNPPGGPPALPHIAQQREEE